MSIFITVIIIAMYLLSMLAGYKKGLLKDGEYYISIVISILFTAVFGAIIQQTVLNALGFQNSVGFILLGWVFKIVLFAVVFFVTKTIVRNLLNSDRQEKSGLDRICGALFSLIKTTILIWILDAILSVGTVFAGANAFLHQSWLYSSISNLNLITKMF